MNRDLRTLFVALTLAACSGGDDTDTDTDAGGDTDATGVYDPVDIPTDAVDHTEVFPAADWTDPVVLSTPEFWIPPYSEKEICFISTWEGETVGIHKQRSFQNKYGHHFIVASIALTEREIADGSVVDCTSNDAVGMESFKPLIIGGNVDQETHIGTFELPEGMGARLDKGQRIVLQAHYVNTSAEAIRVRDELQLEVMDPADVTTWASPWVNTESDMVIPPGVDHEVTVTCTAADELTLLFLGGHLHEWGTSISVDRTRDGSTERIYEVAEWDPLFRDAPVYEAYEDGTMMILPGDTYTTTCRWFNDTPADLKFPQEMCVTFGMVYPSTSPIICEQD